jgi:ferredoxin--NADP+ reductase
MPAPPEKFQRVTVVSREDYAADLWSIRVLPEEKLTFVPGQYATLGLQDPTHRMHEKPYSIVSSPLEDEIEFLFELVPQGELTPVLHELKKGDTVLMRRQAKGLFTLDLKAGHKHHYMISTVTGVAPYVSMVRTLVREAQQGKGHDLRVVLLHAASRSWELAYREELAGLADAGSWLRYIPTISRPWEDPDWKGETGRAEDVVRKYMDDWGLEPANTTVYVCGHPTMIENAKGILERRGFPKESIRQEVYWVPKKENK